MANRLWTLTSYFGLKNFWWGSLFSRNLITAPKGLPSSTVDNEEVDKFAACANKWWESDKYSVLHSMNTLRVPLVRDGILSISGVTAKTNLPLKGYKIIDIGCGGGILSEPLARLGASVTGLDPGEANVEVATQHALKDEEIKENLNYVCDTIENFAQNNTGKYDALVCSEVIEHVVNPQSFVNACIDITKDGGSLFFTTLNRTALSYVIAILGAEYVLGIIPRGTHDWNKFIQPKELSDMLQSLNCRIVSVDGANYNPLTQKWSWGRSNAVFYALHAIK